MPTLNEIFQIPEESTQPGARSLDEIFGIKKVEPKDSFGSKVVNTLFPSTKKLVEVTGDAFKSQKANTELQAEADTYIKAENDLINTYASLKQAGQDTTEVEKQLKSLRESRPDYRSKVTGRMEESSQRTFGQNLATGLGAGIETVGLLVPAGELKAAATATKPLRAAFTGAGKAGAAWGGAQSGLNAISEDKSAGEVIKDTAMGAAFGGLTAGTLGAGAAVAGKAISKAKDLFKTLPKGTTSAIEAIKQKVSGYIPTREEEVIDLITPEMSRKNLANAIAKGGGVVKRGTVFDTVEIAPGKKILDAYEQAKDIIDPKLTATENINKVRDVISVEADALKKALDKEKVIFTFKELQSKLNKAQLPVGFKREAVEYGKLKDVINTAMKISKAKGGKVSQLLEARQEFDRLVKESFPNLFDSTGKPTTTYNAVMAVRNTMNDFIENAVPNVKYKNSLKKQSLLYDVVSALDEKAAREVGAPTSRVTRKIKSVMRKNPKATAAAKVLGGLTGAGIAGGIGSAIID